MKKRNQILAAVFWLMSAAIAVFIFYMSSYNGDNSADMSQELMSSLNFPFLNLIDHNVFRKFAHFAEFAALGFNLCGAFHFTFPKIKSFYAMIPCVLYAAADEIHQYFVPDRACRIFDVFVDSLGSLTGILFLLLLLFLISKNKKNNK